VAVDPYEVVRLAERFGAEYAEARVQDYLYEVVRFDSGVLREYSVDRRKGVGLRVSVNGYLGFAYTNDVSRQGLEELVKRAVAAARTAAIAGRATRFAERPVRKERFSTPFSEDPVAVDPEEKVRVVEEVNVGSMRRAEIRSAVTALAVERDARLYASSDGADIRVEVVGVGLSHMAVARVGAVAERARDSESAIAGFEFIRKRDWGVFASEIDDLAIKAAQATTPKPGVYTAIIDNELIGLLLHEAFGHASEGDTVRAGASVLRGRLGQEVASPLVTIVDDGLVEGGYPVPFDDEGTPKRKTVVVEKGVLKGYLHSRATAHDLGQEPTGNARAQDFTFEPIVRQTNYYMLPGDYRVEELFEDVDYGIYLRARGSGGGQVNPAMGTFTFSVGPSYIVRKGEIAELVRGVIVSGMILETLRAIDAVARDFKVETSVFGACGKAMQRVRVGHGGPHVRTRRIVVGGGSR